MVAMNFKNFLKYFYKYFKKYIKFHLFFLKLYLQWKLKLISFLTEMDMLFTFFVLYTMCLGFQVM